jgi:hypothetical protein
MACTIARRALSRKRKSVREEQSPEAAFPLPLREREGTRAQHGEGEGFAATSDRQQPPHLPIAS